MWFDRPGDDPIPDDQTTQTTETPGFKPFTVLYLNLLVFFNSEGYASEFSDKCCEVFAAVNLVQTC